MSLSVSPLNEILSSWCIFSIVCMATSSKLFWIIGLATFKWKKNSRLLLLCAPDKWRCRGNPVLLAKKLLSKFCLLDVFTAIEVKLSNNIAILCLLHYLKVAWEIQNTQQVPLSHSLNGVQQDQLGKTFQSCQSHLFLEAYANCICKLPKIMSLHPL